MIQIASVSASLLCAVLLVSSCGGTKNTAPSNPGTHMEFDSRTGTWVNSTKVITPPPHQPGAVIVEQKKPGMMQKFGDTMKKPLKWMHLSKGDPEPEAKP